MVTVRAVVCPEDRIQALSQLKAQFHLVSRNAPALRRPVAGRATSPIRAQRLKEWASQVDRPVAGIVSLQNALRVWEREQTWQRLSVCRQTGHYTHQRH